MTATVVTEIFTDGACRGNPGPGGWGALLRHGQVEKELYGAEPDTTNNRMEMTAVIQALNHLKRPSRIRLTTDSRYVMQGVTEWMGAWKKRQWKTASGGKVKNVDLWLEIDAAIARHEIEWCWVKGHAGHTENERADTLANQGIDEMIKAKTA